MFNRSKTEIDDREEMKKTIALFKPQIAELEAAADAERVAKQKQLLPLSESLIQQRDREISGLQSAAEQAREKEERLRTEAQEALKLKQRTACELASRTNWFDHQLDLLRSEIYKLAPAVISERQKKWRDLINETRSQISVEGRTTRRNIWGQASEIVTSNVSMINRRIDAIGEAIKSAEQMKFHPMLEADAIRRLDALEETFPPLSTEHETIRAPLPDVSEFQRPTL